MSFRARLDSIRALARGERAHDDVRAIAGFHRIQASPGYDAAAQWLVAQLEAAGLVPEIETVPGDGVTRYLGAVMPEGWECRSARAALRRGAEVAPLCDFAAEPLSVIQRSDPVRGEFPIVALDDGTEDAHYDGIDVRGAVVLTHGAPHRVHALAVVERGAAGLLCDTRRLFPPVRDAGHDRDALAYTSFWWAGDAPRGWGFVVSPDAGDALRAELRAGGRPRLEAEIDSRRFATAIPLVSTRIGGGDEEVLVLAHLCHPKPSANDNASGAAAALETARVLGALTRDGWRPRRAVRVLWIPELTGTYAWFGIDPSRARRIVAALNLDMVGERQDACGSTLLIEHPPALAASFAAPLLARIRAEAPDWITSYSGPGHYSSVRMAEVPYSGGSDHAVLIDPALGIPCPMLIQWPDRFYHSSLDTPDKTDPRSLELAVRCAATYAAHVAELDAAGAAALADLVDRDARAGLLRALDAPDAARASARAIVAGGRALGSCVRLGVAPDAARERTQAFEAFARREAPDATAAADRVAAAGSESDAAPARRIGAPLEMLRHLTPDWERQPREEREALRRLERETPGAPTVFEVAWYACDGARSLDQIAALVELETGHAVRDAIAEFFAWAARRGLVDGASDALGFKPLELGPSTV